MSSRHPFGLQLLSNRTASPGVVRRKPPLRKAPQVFLQQAVTDLFRIHDQQFHALELPLELYRREDVLAAAAFLEMILHTSGVPIGRSRPRRRSFLYDFSSWPSSRQPNPALDVKQGKPRNPPTDIPPRPLWSRFLLR